MGLSHIVFPDIYRAYYKLYRGDLLPNTKEKQITAQNQLLRELISVLPFIKYGAENKISNSDINIETLQSLPIVRYEDIHPWIDRVWNGEDNVLWYGKTNYFAKSSGTTNARSKYIPVTRESMEQNHFLSARDVLANYLGLNPKSKLGFNSVLTITGSIQDRNEIAQTEAGDISTVLDLNSPWWTDLTKVLPKNILEIPSWEERLPKIVEFLKNVDVKAFAGTVTWIHIILSEVVKKYGVKSALEIWPNLEVFFHGAVSMKPYMSEFKKLIPTENFYYIENYNASEGFFAFQDTNDENNGMLLLCGHGIFYEFINTKTGLIYTIENLELGEFYEMVISTVSGLWRYRIGDVVEITSIDPVRIRVAGRTEAVLNAYGEELMVGNVDEAIRQINENHNYSIGEYTGCPIYKSGDVKNGGHVWVMEFDTIPNDINEFTKLFDETLRSLNSDYDAKRKGNIVLDFPVVHPVFKGTFYEWMKSRNKLGGQNKIPRLCDKNDYVEDIKKFM